jgi:hypothetical protein
MFHRAPRVISPFLDGVFGLLGIAILALLACIGMGLTIARIEGTEGPALGSRDVDLRLRSEPNYFLVPARPGRIQAPWLMGADQWPTNSG